MGQGDASGERSGDQHPLPAAELGPRPQTHAHRGPSAHLLARAHGPPPLAHRGPAVHAAPTESGARALEFPPLVRGALSGGPEPPTPCVLHPAAGALWSASVH